MKETFILLTRLVSEEVRPSFSIEAKAHAVKENVKAYCPKVKWIADYATMGPWDYLDVFEAPDTETAMKVAELVRYYGGAQTEVWPAINWDKYKEILRGFSETRQEKTG